MEWILETPSNQPIVIRDEDNDSTTNSSSSGTGSEESMRFRPKLRNPRVRRCLFPNTITRSATKGQL